MRREVRAIHTVGTIAEWAGGPSRTVTGLCSALVEAGAQVQLVCGYDPVRDRDIVLPGNSLVKVKLAHGSHARPNADFYRLIRSSLADMNSRLGSCIIHDHGIWSSYNALSWLAAMGSTAKMIVSPRGMLEPWALAFGKAKKRLAWVAYQRRILHSTAALIATSTQERDSIWRVLPSKLVAVIPNGVSLPASVEIGPTQQPHRTLLFMSRIHPKKNLVGLLTAWASICATHSVSSWRLIIAGPDELRHTDELRSMIAAGRIPRVELRGPVGEGEKSSLYRQSDLFILPSHSENFGVVVAEALAHGVPVITTKGTPWQCLEQQACGWWIDDSPASIAATLAQAMQLEQSALSKMGARGRDFVRATYAWERIGEMTFELYHWLLNGGTRPSHVTSES
jgi:glycosyltransferase involved in cell wall biosynthesis